MIVGKKEDSNMKWFRSKQPDMLHLRSRSGVLESWVLRGIEGQGGPYAVR